MSICAACGDVITDGACLCEPCPQCGRGVPDLDGFGILAHLGGDGCGFCVHPSTMGEGVTDDGNALERCNVCERLLEYAVNGHIAKLVRVVEEA